MQGDSEVSIRERDYPFPAFWAAQRFFCASLIRFRAAADIFRRFRATGATLAEWSPTFLAVTARRAGPDPDFSPGNALRIALRSSSSSRRRDAAPKRAHFRMSTVCFVAMSRA